MRAILVTGLGMPSRAEMMLGPLMAGATLTILPVFIVFLLAQRYFIQGVTGSAFKG